MGLFTRDIKSLEDLFNHSLKDIYYAEQQIYKTLPKLIDQAADAQLKRDLKDHRVETEAQIGRLEKIFSLLEQSPHGTRCPGIDGILSEGDSVLSEVEGRAVTNAAIIAAAQAVEHYEITRYGALIAWAEEFGRPDIVRLLQQNLREEKAADKKLTAAAESRISDKASKSTRRPTAARKTRKRVNRRRAA